MEGYLVALCSTIPRRNSTISVAITVFQSTPNISLFLLCQFQICYIYDYQYDTNIYAYSKRPKMYLVEHMCDHVDPETPVAFTYACNDLPFFIAQTSHRAAMKVSAILPKSRLFSAIIDRTMIKTISPTSTNAACRYWAEDPNH